MSSDEEDQRQEAVLTATEVKAMLEEMKSEILTEVTTELINVRTKLAIVTNELTLLKEKNEQKAATKSRSIGNDSLISSDEAVQSFYTDQNDKQEGAGTTTSQNLVHNETNSVYELVRTSPNDMILNKKANLELSKYATRCLPLTESVFDGPSNTMTANFMDEDDAALEYDVFTMMMQTPPVSRIVINSQTMRFCNGFPWITNAWILGISVFCLQAILGGLFLISEIFDTSIMHLCGGIYCRDQPTVKAYDDNNPFNVPLRATNRFVQFAQGVTIPLALVFQTDILAALRTLYALRHREHIRWHETIGIPESERSRMTWIVRIFIPNFLKLLEAITVLIASWMVIIQSDNIGGLLKDFSALLVISSLDNILFMMAANGFFGKNLLGTTRKVKAAKLGNHEANEGMGCLFVSIVIAMLCSGIALWGIFIRGQRAGEYFLMNYPECVGINNGRDFYEFAGDGICNGFLNNEKCGYDLGDCDTFSVRYPGCFANYTVFLGDGICQGASYNTEGCNYDFGDCVDFNSNYPDCDALLPYLVGNEECDIEYNVTECDYDGGDCIAI